MESPSTNILRVLGRIPSTKRPNIELHRRRYVVTAAQKESELTAYDSIKLFKLDVTDIQQVQVATEQAIAAFGKIDGVVSGARRSGRNSTYPIVQILRAGSLRKKRGKDHEYSRFPTFQD